MQQRGQFRIHLRKPLRCRVFLAQLHSARTQVPQLRSAGVAVHLDHSVAGKLSPTIDAEHPHAMKFTLSRRRLALSPHPTRYNQRRIHPQRRTPNAPRNPTSTDTLILPQHLTLLLLASASLTALGQQDAAVPAPARPAAPVV